MDVKTIILGFLSEGEMSGYDIKQAFSNSIGFFYDASFGAIYPALRKLEEEGLVTKQEIIQSGKPNKILYQITDSGKDLFYQEMASPIVPPILRSDMLVKIFFAGNRTVEEREELFANGLQMQKKLLENTKKAFAKMADSLDPYQTFCWKYTMNHLEMTIKFIEDQAPHLLKQ
ncbi:PadR family transcriptional regulator [Brevibacillus migulae]|uniref:PadR family transcriptional regulator n=1 Tax=Brevibacillus migulae TaxID=1644114 RepID=UPI00106EDF01|nr:PadR family transcriptional regulator [Brevibacillus migulae]